jgi:RNA polymerase sigma factor (sigma-70 family)
MAANADTLIQYIRRLAKRPKQDDASDAALLRRYVSERDPKAFAALVERHGPLVWNVCRRVLGDAHDAEDAFQAAFLVLLRKADTLRSPEELAGWLHGVARRVALKARTARVRRLSEVRLLADRPPRTYPDPLAELSARELLTVLDEEVQRLPTPYRLPVILCDLERRSQEEAARQLGWSPGSVKGRLERGRARLHDRLARRGLTLSAVLMAAEVAHGVASSRVVTTLADAIVRGVPSWGPRYLAAAGGVASARAQALAGEAVGGIAPRKIVAAVGLVLATCLTTVGFVIYKGASAAKAVPETDSAGWVNHSTQAEVRNEQDEPVEVFGRVLDPAGKPLAGAKLYVGYSSRPLMPAVRNPHIEYPLRATSAADGSFRFRFARSELSPKWLNELRPAVLASATGYAPDWAEIGESVKRAELRLRLGQNLPVPGVFFEPNRRLVPGAKLTVHGVSDYGGSDLERVWEQGGKFPSTNKHWVGPLPGQEETLTTGADGCFRVPGIGRDRLVYAEREGQVVGLAWRWFSEAEKKRAGSPLAAACSVAMTWSSEPERKRVEGGQRSQVQELDKAMFGVRPTDRPVKSGRVIVEIEQDEAMFGVRGF